MTTEFFLWLLPGYIIVLFHRRISPHRNSSGWDFIALVGLYAAVVYAVVHALQPILRRIPGIRSIHAGLLQDYLGISLPPHCGLLPLAITVALLYGVAMRRSKAAQELAWNLSSLDPMSLFLRDVMKTSSHVIITMKNGKVYVGLILKATFDRNEANKYCSVGIELSGYRQKDTHKVILDKNYKAAYSSQSPRRQLEMVLPYSEIASLAHFSMDVTEHFVIAGLAQMGPDRVEPAAVEHVAPVMAADVLAIPPSQSA